MNLYLIFTVLILFVTIGFGQAYARGGYYNRLFWNKKHFTEEETLEALQKITLDDIKNYANKLYERVFITGLAHGNWTDKDVKDGVTTLLSEIKKYE